MSVATDRRLAGTAFRFLIAGGLNTLVTGALLSVLATLIHPFLAYTIVFAAGIVLSTYLAGAFVFRVKMSRRHVIAYVLLYVAVYLVGLGAVALAVRMGLDEAYTGLVVLVTAPLTFLGGRLLLHPSAEEAPAAPAGADEPPAAPTTPPADGTTAPPGSESRTR